MPLDQGPSALTCCNITKTTCRKRHPVHRHEEVSSGKERVPGRQKQSLKVGQGCHLCIQTACHSLSGLSHPLLVPPEFLTSLPSSCHYRDESQKQQQRCKHRLAPKSGEGGRKVRKKRKGNGNQKEKTNLRRAESTAHVSRGAKQVITKLGPYEGEKAPSMMGDRTMRLIPLRLSENKSQGCHIHQFFFKGKPEI